jgi:hypothetical protein
MKIQKSQVGLVLLGAVLSSALFQIGIASANIRGGPFGSVLCLPSMTQISFGSLTGRTEEQAKSDCSDTGGTAVVMRPVRLTALMSTAIDRSVLATFEPSSPSVGQTATSPTRSLGQVREATAVVESARVLAPAPARVLDPAPASVPAPK